jgi:predicted dehydrogenase
MFTEQEGQNATFSRRNFIKTTAAAGAASFLSGAGGAFAAGSDKIRVGLVGCGGRGTGAGIIDCAESAPGVELTAIGDLFEDHLREAPGRIRENLMKRNLPVDDIYKVTQETMFSGFDACKNVIAADVDMIILTTPPNFRPQYLRAAVEAGKHVFIEKPIAVDPVGVRHVIESAKMAREKGLTIVAGTQMRRLTSYRDVIGRIHDGAIGDILGGQNVRCGGAMRSWRTDEKDKRSEWSDMEYQIRRWLFWTWLSGDFIVEMHVHNLDIINWVMQSHPVQCMAVGGRQARHEPEFGNVYDHFSAEYVYPGDVRIEYMGTQIDEFSVRNDQRLKGTKGSVYMNFGNAVIKGDNPYEFNGKQSKPAVLEYTEMIDSIRNDKAINEAVQVAESTMTAIMGRMSAYTGRALKWQWAMEASKLDLSPPEMAFGDHEARPVAVPGITELI